jgi:AraC-like DNA-binding protein
MNCQLQNPLATADEQWTCPQSGGDLSLTRLGLRDGLELMVQNFRPSIDTEVEVNRAKPPIHFGYLVRGEFQMEIKNDSGRSMRYHGMAGFGGVMFMPHTTSLGYYTAQSRVIAVALDVSTRLFGELARETAPALPRQLRSIAQGRPGRDVFVFQSQVTARLASVLQDIINVPLGAPCSSLYAEAKVLELMSLQIGQFIETPKRVEQTNHLDRAAKRGVGRVRDLLESNLQNPPSLIDMSREAGMSHAKLNRCFKQLYGQTVFEYLRQARLDKARRLLSGDTCSIAEAALLSGFSDQSHLNRCFKRHFGVTPGLYRRGQRM